MIQLKTMRLSNPLFGGSNTIRATDAEMFFEPLDGVVYIKRRVSPYTEYLASLGTVEHMEPMHPLKDIFANILTVEMQKNGEYALPALSPPSVLKAIDDTVRLVKINGMIVERKGEKRQDEIDALEYAALEREEFSKKSAMVSIVDSKKGKKPMNISEMLESTKLGAEEE